MACIRHGETLRSGLEPGRRSMDRGVSLAEVLVAITVLALAMSIALVLYDGANRTFRVGENLAEQQQIIRIAFDIVGRDLRIAGLNTNPDGIDRPDEQIEAAFDTAIVIRADFDGNDSTESNAPEEDLSGGAFLSVSTGNDEIVGYVLGKPPGDDVSTGTMTFTADVVGVPRDGLQENVEVSGVDLAQEDPPYTLYRITVAEDGGSAQKLPLIDNVRSLRFTYWDETGAAVPAPGGNDDPDGEPQRRRAEIRRIGVEIEGLTRDRDLRWADPDDSNVETQGFRKFQLAGDVVPRNLGRFGLRDLDAPGSGPPPPPPPTLYPGHCNGLWMEWEPRAEVARWEIWYGTGPDVLTGPLFSLDASFYLTGLTNGTQYYATVAAVDDSGDVSAPSDPGTALASNENRPLPPQNPGATSGLESVIDFSWEVVTENDPDITPEYQIPDEPRADPMMPGMRDHAGYKIYRSDGETSFPLLTQYLIYETTDINATSFPDTDIVNCRTYVYKVTAVDACGAESLPSEEIFGDAVTLINPEAPDNLQAFRAASSVGVTWDEVIRNVAGDKVHIEDYEVWRTPVVSTGSPPGTFALIQTVYGKTNYVDPLLLGPSDTAYYKVRALDDCLNSSAFSDTAEPTCEFSGTVLFQWPRNDDSVDADSTVQVEVDLPTASYDLTLTYQHLSDPAIVDSAGGPGPVWTRSWPLAAVASGPWRIDAVVTQDNGCSQVTSILVNKD